MKLTFFTNRTKELEMLKESLEGIKNNSQKRIALVGLRRIGKTMLLDKFIQDNQKETDVDIIFMDFENLCITPEIFAMRYIGSISHYFCKEVDGDLQDYFEIDSLFANCLKSKYVSVKETATKLKNELSKTNVDKNYLIDLALTLPEKISIETKKPILLILDEFQEISELKNFKQTKNIMSFFRSIIQKQENISYIICGSVISAIMKLIEEGESPLFVQFDRFDLENFSKEHTRELAKKIFNSYKQIDYSEEIFDRIYFFTNGNPFYIDSLCNLASLISIRSDKMVDNDLINFSFVADCFDTKGKIYAYLKYIYEISLEKAVGGTMLKKVLLIVSKEEGLTLSQIAKKMKKLAGEINKYLKSLMEVDIIVRSGDKYYFRDSVFKQWVSFVLSGGEIDIQNMKSVKRFVKELEDKYLESSRHLGLAIEYQFKNLVEQFDNRIIEGDNFGTKENIRLPKFDKIGRVIKFTNMEFDLSCENKEKWLIGIRWRTRPTQLREVMKYYEKNKNDYDKIWYISKSGFMDNAKRYMESNNIFYSEKKEMIKIFELFDMRLDR